MQPSTHPEDICVWANGTWCFREDQPEFTHLSDDFFVLEVDSEGWRTFDPDQPLKHWEQQA